MSNFKMVIISILAGLIGIIIFFIAGSWSSSGIFAIVATCLWFLFGASWLSMKQPKGRPFHGISMNIPLWLFFIFWAETGQFKSFIWGLVACLGVTQLGVFLGKWCSALRPQIFRRILLFSIPAAVILAVILFKVVQMPTPIPADKLQFIGEWKTLSGFELQIGADGTARILNNSSGSPSLNIPVGPPGTIDGFNVQFAGDSTLEIVKPAYFGKTYKINLCPMLDSSGYLMILNGITLYRQ